MKSKKSVSQMMELLVIIFLIVLFVYLSSKLYIYFFGKETSELKERFISIEDYDKDGVSNIADKCPCPPQGFGVMENEGCPANYKIKGDGQGIEDRTCLSKKT